MVLIQLILATVLTNARNGEFKQQTVASYKRTNETVEKTVIHLFKKGITVSEISSLIEKMYGYHYTPQTISNMKQVRLSTFNRRLAGVKYWLTHEYALQFTSEHAVSVKLLCSLYDQEAYLRLKPMRGKLAEKKSDMRKRALCCALFSESHYS